MEKSNLRHIGKVKDAHGLQGELFIIFFSKDYSWAQDLENIFIDDVSYEILKLSEHKDGLKVKLKGLSNRNQSESLIGQSIYVAEDFFTSEDGDSIYLSEIENFLVIDQVFGELGRIKSFSYNGAQDLLVINYKNKDIEIPFVEEFVEEINYDEKTIHMNLPDGLIEIND